MRVFLWKLWSSIKEHKAPFLFELEHQIFLYPMPGDQASSHGKGKVSWLFLSCVGNWDIFSRDGGDGLSKVVCVQQHQDSSLLARDRLGFSSRNRSAIGSLVKGSWRLKVPFYLPQVYWDSSQFSRGGSHLLILKHLSPQDYRVITGL